MASEDFQSIISDTDNINSILFSDSAAQSESNLTNQTSRTKNKSRPLTSTIHRYTRARLPEDEGRTTKLYLCSECPPDLPSGWHPSSTNLQRHLKSKHNIICESELNSTRTTANESVQHLYDRILKQGKAKELEGEVLRRTVEKNLIKQTLLDLIIVRRLPFSCVEWPEFHAFVRAINQKADQPVIIPTHHTTIMNWITASFVESQDIIRRRLQSTKTPIHLAVDIWTCPNHTLLLGICASFLNVND